MRVIIERLTGCDIHVVPRRRIRIALDAPNPVGPETDLAERLAIAKPGYRIGCARAQLLGGNDAGN